MAARGSDPVIASTLPAAPLERDIDFRDSPHLAQWALHSRLRALVEATVRYVAAAGLPLHILEITAGHGGCTEGLLADGCTVTSVEMSTETFLRTRDRWRTNARLTRVLDPVGSLRGVGDGYSLVVCVSVLHHVPDYVGLLRRLAARVVPDGAVLTCQDPLFYPRVGRATLTVDRAAYLAWRLGQGNLRGGLAALRRRMRGDYPEQGDGELTYYHVVRQGVDEVAVASALDDGFAGVEVLRYWSNHLNTVRRPAEAVGLRNTFAVRALGRADASRVRAGHPGHADGRRCA